MVLKKSAPNPEDEVISKTTMFESTKRKTKKRATQPLCLSTKDSDTTPADYVNKGVRLDFGEPRIQYDESPCVAPQIVPKLSRANSTPIGPRVLDQGYSTKRREGAKPSSHENPAKTTSHSRKPLLGILERQQKLERVETLKSVSRCRRRRQRQPKAEELTQINPKGVVVSTEIREEPE